MNHHELRRDQMPLSERYQALVALEPKLTLRVFRGTDELPWFKDLAYYKGAVSVWRHLEGICGDDLRFTFVLLGKNDPASKTHERIVYETSSK